eukprot:3068442-Alexandrium_andersonii.AAC.1
MDGSLVGSPRATLVESPVAETPHDEPPAEQSAKVEAPAVDEATAAAGAPTAEPNTNTASDKVR